MKKGNLTDPFHCLPKLDCEPVHSVHLFWWSEEKHDLLLQLTFLKDLMINCQWAIELLSKKHKWVSTSIIVTKKIQSAWKQPNRTERSRGCVYLQPAASQDVRLIHQWRTKRHSVSQSVSSCCALSSARKLGLCRSRVNAAARPLQSPAPPVAATISRSSYFSSTTSFSSSPRGEQQHYTAKTQQGVRFN